MNLLPPSARAVSADCAFIIGQSHHDTAKPCQDYALTEAQNTAGWAVVSDGCSTGGRTDIGSRMWATAARQVLRANGLSALADPDECATRLHAAATPLLAPFELEDGYATLVLAASDGLSARVLVYGDGVVMLRFKDGRLKFWDIDYDQNAPRYLNYERNPAVLEAWSNSYGRGRLRVRVSEHSVRGELLSLEASEQGSQSRAVSLHWEDLTGLEALFVCTDGAVSFEDRGRYEGLRPLSDVKNPVGQFMQRRLGALLRKWRKDGNKGPTDDLAVAALWFGERSDVPESTVGAESGARA